MVLQSVKGDVRIPCQQTAPVWAKPCFGRCWGTTGRYGSELRAQFAICYGTWEWSYGTAIPTAVGTETVAQFIDRGTFCRIDSHGRTARSILRRRLQCLDGQMDHRCKSKRWKIIIMKKNNFL